MYSCKHYKSPLDGVKMFQNDELLNEPGTAYSYSTYGYTLLSAVADKILESKGMNFVDELLNMTKMIGMTSTFVDENQPLIANRSSYYDRLRKRHELVNVPSVDCSYKIAGGGLLSNAPDLLTFAHALLYSKNYDGTGPTPLLSKSTIDMMWKRAISYPIKRKRGGEKMGYYSLGFAIDQSDDHVGPEHKPWNERDWVGHAGGAVGTSSFLLIKPCVKKNKSQVNGICVAVITNLQSVNLQNLALQIAGIFDQIDN